MGYVRIDRPVIGDIVSTHHLCAEASNGAVGRISRLPYRRVRW
jgi:hypothetical protein